MSIWKIKEVDGGFPRLGGTAALADASLDELRVLLCLVSAGGRVSDPADLAAAAGCSKPRARSALRYWEEVGVTEQVEEEAVAEQEVPVAVGAETTKKPLRESGEIAEAPAREIAKVVTEQDLATFIDTCQQTVGRLFNTRELNSLTGLIEAMPFSQEYILTLISYCIRKTGKFSFSYLEKVAHTMLERELLTVEQLNAYLEAAERFASQEWRLRRMLGFGERRLTDKETERLMRWTGEYGFGEGIIGIAYDIAVNQTGKVSLPYMDKLLTRFHEAGCGTVGEVEAFLEKEQAEHAASKLPRRAGKPGERKTSAFATGAGEGDKTATRGSSFQRGDYMAAALRRSYGDDGAEDDK